VVTAGWTVVAVAGFVLFGVLVFAVAMAITTREPRTGPRMAARPDIRWGGRFVVPDRRDDQGDEPAHQHTQTRGDRGDDERGHGAHRGQMSPPARTRESGCRVQRANAAWARAAPTSSVFARK
jgi:hypothetical protein